MPGAGRVSSSSSLVSRCVPRCRGPVSLGCRVCVRASRIDIAYRALLCFVGRYRYLCSYNLSELCEQTAYRPVHCILNAHMRGVREVQLSPSLRGSRASRKRVGAHLGDSQEQTETRGQLAPTA